MIDINTRKLLTVPVGRMDRTSLPVAQLEAGDAGKLCDKLHHTCHTTISAT